MSENTEELSAKELMERRVKRLEEFHKLVLEACEKTGMHEEYDSRASILADLILATMCNAPFQRHMAILLEAKLIDESQEKRDQEIMDEVEELPDDAELQD